MAKKIKIGIIGYGYWGPNLVRNFSEISECQIKGVADLSKARLKLFKQKYPSLIATQDVNDLIKNRDIDAIVVATPVRYHYELAKKILLSGKHVLIEKPMTTSVKEAKDLINISRQKNKVLMVDHTFLYTGAVQKIKSLVNRNEIGKVKYFDSTRINLGLFQSDINVLWDLATHDLSILHYLIKEKPRSVQAIGISHTNNGVENIGYMILKYKSGLIAHFNCSWCSPVKIRTILIGGDKKMILYNDIEPTEKVKVYDTGYKLKRDEDKRNILVDYRIGDIFAPKTEDKEALLTMAKDFIDSIIKNKEPVSNGLLGLNVVNILETAQFSIKNRGKEICL